MKIVCDACQAKYSISDDKVQGKVFKIRCKKCSNIIVVRGGAGAAEPAPQPAAEKDTRVYDYGYEGGGAPAGDDAVWHVVINDGPVGPITVAEMQQRFAAGEIDAETYVWREGFAEWQPLAQVDAFAAFAQASAPASAAADVGGGADAMASMFGSTGIGDDAGTMRSDPADLFAAASAGSRRNDDDGDLFGSKPGTGSRQPVAGGSAADAATAKLRGERNENSVLFSLNNLAQLASDKPAPITAPPSASSLGHATGAAGGEGSGLIDIRSMANAYLGGAGAAAKPATSAAVGSIDDLPVFGGGGFSEPAVIVPTANRTSNNKMMYALIGAVGLLAVAAVILVVMMLGGKDEPKKSALAANTEDKDKDKDQDVGKEPDKTDPKETTAATDPKPAETTDPKGPETKPDPKEPERPKPAGTTAGTTRPTRPTGGTVARPTETKPKPAESKPEAGGSCDEVSCVLNNYEGACCQKFRKGGAPKPSGGTTRPSGSSDLPEKLDRAIISDGLARVRSAVMKCGDRSSAKGTVMLSTKVTPAGGVSQVTVTSTPDPALGSCVQAAMRGATFRKTQTGGSFKAPFSF